MQSRRRRDEIKRKLNTKQVKPTEGLSKVCSEHLSKEKLRLRGKLQLQKPLISGSICSNSPIRKI